MNKWKIIYDTKKKYYNSVESDIQTIWEKLLSDSSVFGYSSINNEVKSHVQKKIGSTNKVIPDLIVQDSNDNKDLFVVELKQYNLPYNDGFRDQLFSYMRLFLIPVGVLVCKNIYVYVLKGDQYLELEIPFEEDSMFGHRFVDVFSKKGYEYDNVVSFIEDCLRINKNISFIKKELTNEKVKQIITDYYYDKYSIYETQEALKNKKFEIIDERITQSSLRTVVPEEKLVFNKINKTDVRDYLLAKELINTNSVVTFASLNKNGRYYWANPKVDYLNKELVMILNDKNNKKIYIFKIPSNALTKQDVVVRNDKPHLIDFNISYNDDNFKCLRSKIEFKQWLIGTYTYTELGQKNE